MLTETAIKAAKGADKPYKLFDEKSLFLLVNPTGARLWRLKYRLHGKEKLLAIGSYPDITLKRAREKRDDARKLIADGIDPSIKKKSEKNAALDTFEVIAAEWFGQQNYKPKTRKKVEWLLRDWLNKYLGSRPIRTITAPDILAICRRLEARGKRESAHRVRGLASRVFRYAIATGRADRDPSQDLRGALAPIVVTNHAAITEPKKIGELLRAIDDYQGQPGTSAALKLAPLTFVRPGELRAAHWSEFELDGDTPQWRISGERMKLGDQHLVPLSRQAVAILRDLHAATGYGKFLFPSLRSSLRCISDNTINAALRRLGYGKEEMVGHGFRSMASTCLNEQGWHPDLIELQLAHAERNKVRAAYNRAERLAERRKMMQAWADYLDGLKARGDKVALNDAPEPAVAASNP